MSAVRPRLLTTPTHNQIVLTAHAQAKEGPGKGRPRKTACLPW